MIGSGLSLVLCASMLIVTSFAWFTDSITNKGNTIQSGELKIQAAAYDLDAGGDKTYTVPGLNGGEAFRFEKEGMALGDQASPIIEEEGFEPGKSNAKLITVTNTGTLAAKIKLDFDVQDGGLMDALWYDFIQVQGNQATGRFERRPMNTLKSYADGIELPVAAQNGTVSFILTYGMEEDAGNAYQGKSFSADVTILARQDTVEQDGFGNSDYDAQASYFSVWDGESRTAPEALDMDPSTKTVKLHSAADLAGLADAVNAGMDSIEGYTVVLTANIDLAGMEWIPIGGTEAFTGTFDGAGHRIKNLKSTGNPHGDGGDSTRGIALFGYAENAVFRDLKIENCDLSGRYAVAGLVGDGCAPLTFENIEITGGTIKADQNIPGKTAQVAGGLLGQGWGSAEDQEILFRGCVNQADVVVNQWHAGGLWGSITQADGVDVTVENCRNYGDITSLNQTGAGGYAGGLGGFAAVHSCTVTGCKNYGTITADKYNADFVAYCNGYSITESD